MAQNKNRTFIYLKHFCFLIKQIYINIDYTYEQKRFTIIKLYITVNKMTLLTKTNKKLYIFY